MPPLLVMPTASAPSRHAGGWRPEITADGSFTLACNSPGVSYHSLYGAVQESRHVFIAMGLDNRPVDERTELLEVGLGTGLNLLLTWLRCLGSGRSVRYTALEPFPVDAGTLAALAHTQALGRPDLEAGFLGMMNAPAGTWFHADGGMAFRRLSLPLQQLEDRDAYDLVYHDAFAPGHQPELWDEEALEVVRRAMRADANWVTFCAKGDVRRRLQALGFTVERLPGPPGKREMLRATRHGPR